MEFYNFKKNKKRRKFTKIIIERKFKKIKNLINSELTSKIQNSFIKDGELTIEINENDLIEVVQFLKSNEKCKFRQLIDIAGVDFPEEENVLNLFIFFYPTKIIIELKIINKF